MNTQPHTPQEWATQAVAALEQTAVGLLASGVVTASDPRPPTLDNGHAWAALVHLKCNDESIHLALSSTRDGCANLAGEGLYEDPANLSSEMISDAMGETINIVGGILEQGIQEWDPHATLGLPVVVERRIATPRGSHSVAVPVKIDDVEVELLVVRGSRTTAELVV